MKWLLTILLLFGVVGAAQGGQNPSEFMRLSELAANVDKLKELQAQPQLRRRTHTAAGGWVTSDSIIKAATQAEVEPEQVSNASVLAMKPEKQAAFYIVKPGDEGLKRFGALGWAQVVKLNKNQLANPNRIFPGQKLRLPENVRARDDVKVFESVVVKTRAAKPIRPVKASCVNLNVAPFNRYDSLRLRLEGIDANPALTAEEKAEAKALVSFGRGVRGLVTSSMVFKAMPFRSKDGTVKFLSDVRVCTPEEGGRPEALETWELSTGTVLADFTSCGNITPMVVPPKASPPVVVRQEPQPQPEPQPEPEPEKPQPEPTPQVTPEPKPQEVPPEEAVRRWDWELVVGKEYDRTAQSMFASGAVYGLIVEGDGAEHAFGIGGTYSGWHGKTDTGFGFNGRLSGYGPAYKYSDYDGGWDFGLKLLPWAELTENGAQAAYKSRRQFDLRGITLAYNNYAREMKGEKSLFKYQLFVSAFQPTGSEAEHSVFNQPLPDPDTRLDHVLNVGGRIGLYDFSQEGDTIGSKLWFAAGWFQEAPSLAETANWRLQWSDMHERIFIGFGRNYDLLNGGNIFGFGWSWDVRKTVYVHREEARKAQFIAKIEQAGGRLDKDGMVILPKGMNSPQKQFKIAPSDD